MVRLNDGQNREAVIHENAFHERVWLEFRPFVISERDDVVRALMRKPDPQQAEYMAGVMARRVVSWDLREDGKDECLPIDKGVFLMLPAPLFNRIWAIVMQSDAGDQPSADESRALEIAEAESRNYGDVLQEDTEKN